MLSTRPWTLLPPAPSESRAAHPGAHPVVAQVLFNRGLTRPEDAAAFLLCDRTGFHDPLALPGVAQAVTRLMGALGRDEEVCVFGDYDADGVCGTAILIRTLRAMGLRVRWYLPDRVSEGYGLNPGALARLATEGVRVVLSVDNGISAVAEARVASELGLDLLVTDHHSLPPELPTATALVHPRLPGSTYPFGWLCGAGVAFKLATALVQAAGLDPELLEDLMVLAAIGTVADVVPMVGENRCLVGEGLRRLNEEPAVALAALCGVAQVMIGSVDTDTVGYQLGPRLNAAGRIADAGLALRLLLSDEAEEALALAQELEEANQQRRAQTESAVESARVMAMAEGDAPLLVLASPDWHLGVVGLVAARLAEEFNRPAFVARAEGQMWKGSVRTPAGVSFSAVDSLSRCSDLLDRFGGHLAAAGFSVAAPSFNLLKARLLGLDGLPRLEDGRPPLVLDAGIQAAELDFDLRRELQRLAPFGPENREPVLALFGAEVRDIRRLSEGKHLKVTVRGRLGAVHGVAFNQAEALDWVRPGVRVDLAFGLGLNVYQQMQALELKLVDIRPAE